MKRYHLFEIMDQPWCSDNIRNYGTDVLEYWMHHFDTYKPIYEKIIHMMEVTQSNTIVDLCSGSGGPILQLHEYLIKKNYNYSIYLTDKYPHKISLDNITKNENIHYVEESVDATQLPISYKGMRTLFTSFHHFMPDKALKIIQDATNNNDLIGIFEFTERNPISILKILITPLSTLLLTPFVKPVSVKRLLLTYLIPIIPFVLLWDGIISCLRTYTVSELRALTLNLNNSNYEWEIGKIYSKKAMCNITYLLGRPR